MPLLPNQVRVVLTGFGEWVPPEGVTALDHVLVVAGGGAAGGFAGGNGTGGGGAGGVIYLQGLELTGAVSYAVGAGGLGRSGDSGENGEDSVFGPFVAVGGGGGGGWSGSPRPAKTGGSGGGAQAMAGFVPGATGTTGQGNSGGSSNGQTNRPGGGGGGAGGAGGAVASNTAGAGGAGLYYGDIFGDDVGDGGWFSSGGGGGRNGGAGGFSPQGGGGDGSGSGRGSDGTDGTGGGGGGNGSEEGRDVPGGDGGGGVIIVIYTAPEPEPEPEPTGSATGTGSGSPSSPLGLYLVTIALPDLPEQGPEPEPAASAPGPVSAVSSSDTVIVSSDSLTLPLPPAQPGDVWFVFVMHRAPLVVPPQWSVEFGPTSPKMVSDQAVSVLSLTVQNTSPLSLVLQHAEAAVSPRMVAVGQSFRSTVPGRTPEVAQSAAAVGLSLEDADALTLPGLSSPYAGLHAVALASSSFAVIGGITNMSVPSGYSQITPVSADGNRLCVGSKQVAPGEVMSGQFAFHPSQTANGSRLLASLLIGAT